MKNYEYAGKWYDKILNSFPFLLDTDWIKSIGVAIGFKENDKWVWKPRITGNTSLYYNAVLFVRFSIPFDIRLQIRWAGRDRTKREYFQGGLGWKLNGRFAPTFRFPSDESSAAGDKYPNSDQSGGWDYGTK
jgi:hypothetical protein